MSTLILHPCSGNALAPGAHSWYHFEQQRIHTELIILPSSLQFSLFLSLHTSLQVDLWFFLDRERTMNCGDLLVLLSTQLLNAAQVSPLLIGEFIFQIPFLEFMFLFSDNIK